MKQLLEVIARNLVDHPDNISINEIQDGGTTVLELRVDPDDMGKVIGKHGKIAKSIRTVMKAAAIQEDKRIVVKIV